MMMMMMTELNKRVLDGTAVRINPINTQQISESHKTGTTPLLQQNSFTFAHPFNNGFSLSLTDKLTKFINKDIFT
jgi:hypothetical protein